MNLILFSVTTFAVLDYFYRFMRFVSTDLAKIAKFLCFYSKSGIRIVQMTAQLITGSDRFRFQMFDVFDQLINQLTEFI